MNFTIDREFGTSPAQRRESNSLLPRTIRFKVSLGGGTTHKQKEILATSADFIYLLIRFQLFAIKAIHSLAVDSMLLLPDLHITNFSDLAIEKDDFNKRTAVPGNPLPRQGATALFR